MVVAERGTHANIRMTYVIRPTVCLARAQPTNAMTASTQSLHAAIPDSPAAACCATAITSSGAHSLHNRRARNPDYTAPHSCMHIQHEPGQLHRLVAHSLARLPRQPRSS